MLRLDNLASYGVKYVTYSSEMTDDEDKMIICEYTSGDPVCNHSVDNEDL